MKVLLKLNAFILICSIALCQIKNYVIKKLPSKEIGNPEDAKLIAKNNSYKKCLMRTGIVYYAKEKDTVKRELNLLPVYVTISKNDVQIYTSTNQKTMINLLRLSSIAKISEDNELQGKDAYCFHLHSSLKGIILCTNTLQEKQDWINSIYELKKCNINVQQVNHNAKVVIDFTKVNDLLSLNKTPQKSSKNLKNLSYENTDKPQEDPTQIQIKKHVNKIINDITTANLAKRQIQRKLQIKLEKEQKIQRELNIKKEIIKTNIAKKFEKQRQKKRTQKNLNILKNLHKKIKKIKNDELKNTKKNFKQDVKKLKERRKQMFTIDHPDQKKLTDIAPCLDDRIAEEGSYKQDICKIYYGEIGFSYCKSGNNFCEYCCHFLIGSFYAEKRSECVSKCGKKLCEKKKKKQS